MPERLSCRTLGQDWPTRVWCWVFGHAWRQQIYNYRGAVSYFASCARCAEYDEDRRAPGRSR